MSARVTLVVDDLDPEFERIKQHYAPSNAHQELSPGVLEMQNELQRLQSDLQSFLVRYMGEITALQNRIATRAVNVVLDGPAPTSVAAPNALDNPWPSDPESQKIDESVSTHDDPPSPPLHPAPAVKTMNVPIESHIQDMQAFLKAHVETLQILQNSASVATHPPKDVQKIESTPIQLDQVQEKTFNEQFNMQVLISTFTAGLIVAFLSLVATIIGDSHRIAFSVGMLFAFISLGMHFGNIVIAGRGIALTAQADEKRDAEYFKFYLSVCEQLQFAATLVFIVSTIIMTFFIFDSVAFPIVLIVLSIIGLAIVFVSVYWEVSITFRNLKFLVKNARRLRASLKTISNRHNRKIFPNRFRRNRNTITAT